MRRRKAFLAVLTDESGFNPNARPALCSCPRINMTVGKWNKSAGSYLSPSPSPSPAAVPAMLGAGGFDSCTEHSGTECGLCTESRGDDGYQCLWCTDTNTCHSWDAKPATGCSADQCIRSPYGAHSNCNTVATPSNCKGGYPPSPPHHGSSGFGVWYSHPANGECRGLHYVGDGSGCTWREVAMKRAINATCMYDRLDTNVEQHDPSCFSQCPQPLNHTSTCYEECYSHAIRGMNKSVLVRPWILAFESEDSAVGGCSVVKIGGNN